MVQDLWRSGQPRSIASHAMVKQLTRLAPGLRTIIDGGANHGQFSRACADYFPDANILAFEPSPATADICERNLKDLANFVLVRQALGKTDGELIFNESSDSQCSSFLDGIPGNALLGSATVVQQTSVPVCRLDTFLVGRELDGPAMLKLDLQGFEMPALIGAGERLDDFQYVLIECPLLRAYEGEASFGEITVMMTRRGYEIEGFLNAASRSGTIVQVDALFVRHRESASVQP